MEKARAEAAKVFSEARKNLPDLHLDEKSYEWFFKFLENDYEHVEGVPILIRIFLTHKGYFKANGCTKHGHAVRTIAESLFSKVKEKHPDFNELTCEVLLQNIEFQRVPIQIVYHCLYANLVASGHLERKNYEEIEEEVDYYALLNIERPEETEEEETEENEQTEETEQTEGPSSWIDTALNADSKAAKDFEILKSSYYKAKTLHNRDPV